MNHSSFTDMKLAYAIFYPKRFGIVTSQDAIVGILGKLMRILGCTPTHKYITDLTLLHDLQYMLKKNKTSVLMYPEAGYSFDGTATALPKRMGLLFKKLGVPVVTVITQGAFHRDPLYNMLQIRDMKVSAHVKCIATAEEVKELSVAELDERLEEAFSFDNFAWQRDNKISVDVPFRADGLHRILYKCPHCGAENRMEGKGIHLSCHACGKQWEMDEFGQMKALEGETEYPHIPDWYSWQRECVRQELENGTYLLDTDVEYLATGRRTYGRRPPVVIKTTETIEKIVEKPVIQTVETVVEHIVEKPVVKTVEKPVVKRVYRKKYVRNSSEFLLVGILSFLGIGACIFRQMYWHRNQGSIVLCAGIALMLYEVIIFGIGVFTGLTHWERLNSFLVTGGISVAVMIPLYTLINAIGQIRGNTWKE
jgi:transcription elongation factor Elf1